tara:strand:- start:454 stop:804 length:351 start_codon:yes stop_codon:yes gene_type:complete
MTTGCLNNQCGGQKNNATWLKGVTNLIPKTLPTLRKTIKGGKRSKHGGLSSQLIPFSLIGLLFSSKSKKRPRYSAKKISLKTKKARFNYVKGKKNKLTKLCRKRLKNKKCKLTKKR